jgi:hypothetical protein
MSQLQQTSPPSDQAEKPAAESNPSQQSRRSQRPT